MSSEWQKITLADVVETANTGLDAIRRAPIVAQDTGIKCLRIQDVSQSKCYSAWGNTETTERDYAKYQLKKNDIIMARTCSPGICRIIKSDMAAVFNNGLARIRTKTGVVDPNFLFYVFKSHDFIDYIYGISHGTSVQLNMKVGDLTRYQFVMPPLSVQRIIAALLETLDDRIALLRETNITLEAIAQALFKSWFVDFDPVRAKQEGREPEGLDSVTTALFPDSFEESELGLVPKGWQTLPLEKAVESVGGGTPNTKEAIFWEPAEFAWTTPRDLSGLQSPVLLKTDRLLSAKGVANVSSGLLPKGTLLLSSRAPIGYLAIAQIPLAINQGYIAILPSSQLPPLYMLFWCKQNMEIIKSRSNGSTFMEISKKAFRPIPALVPPVSLINSYMAVAEPVFERLVKNEQQAQTLTNLRDTLLPRLISGQLRLPDAEALVEEAAA
ncbi:MAG: restriction endonuclease subunit S [Desulfobulbus sp.]|nr:restriction endonuclease subunit S [Desulfobulbus sp.]